MDLNINGKIKEPYRITQINIFMTQEEKVFLNSTEKALTIGKINKLKFFHI